MYGVINVTKCLKKNNSRQIQTIFCYTPNLTDVPLFGIVHEKIHHNGFERKIMPSFPYTQCK